MKLPFFGHRDCYELMHSSLVDHNSFYPTFLKDLRACRRELIIESPYITTRRVKTFLPIFGMLHNRGIEVIINTRHPKEHDGDLRQQAVMSIGILQSTGVRILYTGGHHRKLALIDGHILYEGSLNILSQNDSCEIMRRIRSEALSKQMLQFTHLDEFMTR